MNLALQITFLRILLAPFFAWAMIKSPEDPNHLWTALILALLMEATDFFDGYIARKLNLESDAGKILDPMADSIARLTCFIAFFKIGHASVWMILVFVYRDSLVSALRILAASRTIILGARGSGKLKAVAQAISISGIPIILLAEHYQISLYLQSSTIILTLMLIAVAGTLYSLWDYIYANRHLISRLI